MAQNVGTIYYSVEAETEKLLSSSKDVDSSLGKVQSAMGKTDSAAVKLDAKLDKLSSSVRKANMESNAAAQAIGRLGGALLATVSIGTAIAIIQAADAYGEMSERIDQATASSAEYSLVQRRLLDNANATYRPLVEAQELFVRTADTLRGLGYTTSQALDITDSLSLAFVRNSASGARAESAIAAVSASLQKGKVDADAWATILAAVPTIVNDLADSTGKTTNEIRQLGAEGKITGQQLAEGLRKGHDENAQAAADMAVTLKDAYNNLINTLTVYIGEANKASGASGLLAKGLEAITKGFASAAGMLAPQVELNKLLLERQTLQAQLAKTDGTWREDLPPQIEARKRLADIEDRMRVIQNERIEQLKEEKRQQDAIAKNPPPVAETDSSKALANLKQQAELARLSGEARAKLAAIQKLGNEATEAERVEAQALAAEIYRLETGRKAESKTASKAASEKEAAAKKAASAELAGIKQNQEQFEKLGAQLAAVDQSARDVAMMQAELSLNKYATSEQVQQVRDMAAALYDLQQGRQLLAQVDPIAGAQMGYENQLAQLQSLNDAKLLSDQRYLDLKGQAELAHDEQMRVLQEENFRRQSTANALLIDSLNQLQSAGTSATTGLLTGTVNSTEAMQMLGQAILNEVVGSFVEMGISQVKAWVMGQAAQAAAGAAYVASVTGQVAANTALAAQAAFASTAAIPIVGPLMAPAAAATAGAAASALGAPAIAGASASLAGGRQYGGQVAPGGMYRINETGAPEVFNAANGRQYMLPNQRGEVVSNSDATSDSKQVVVNINNAPPGTTANVRQESGRREDDRRFIVDVVVGDFMTDGTVSRAAGRAFGLSRSGS